MEPKEKFINYWQLTSYEKKNLFFLLLEPENGASVEKTNTGLERIKEKILKNKFLDIDEKGVISIKDKNGLYGSFSTEERKEKLKRTLDLFEKYGVVKNNNYEARAERDYLTVPLKNFEAPIVKRNGEPQEAYCLALEKATVDGKTQYNIIGESSIGKIEPFNVKINPSTARTPEEIAQNVAVVLGMEKNEKPIDVLKDICFNNEDLKNGKLPSFLKIPVYYKQKLEGIINSLNISVETGPTFQKLKAELKNSEVFDAFKTMCGNDFRNDSNSTRLAVAFGKDHIDTDPSKRSRNVSIESYKIKDTNAHLFGTRDNKKIKYEHSFIENFSAFIAADNGFASQDKFLAISDYSKLKGPLKSLIDYIPDIANLNRSAGVEHKVERQASVLENISLTKKELIESGGSLEQYPIEYFTRKKLDLNDIGDDFYRLGRQTVRKPEDFLGEYQARAEFNKQTDEYKNNPENRTNGTVFVYINQLIKSIQASENNARPELLEYAKLNPDDFISKLTASTKENSTKEQKQESKKLQNMVIEFEKNNPPKSDSCFLHRTNSGNLELSKNVIYLPAVNTKGAIVNSQAIINVGTQIAKNFAKDQGRSFELDGAKMVYTGFIAGKNSSIENAIENIKFGITKEVNLVEGFATGMAVYKAMQEIEPKRDHVVAVAFSCNDYEKSINFLRALNPEVKINIFADNDIKNMFSFGSAKSEVDTNIIAKYLNDAEQKGVKQLEALDIFSRIPKNDSNKNAFLSTTTNLFEKALELTKNIDKNAVKMFEGNPGLEHGVAAFSNNAGTRLITYPVEKTGGQYTAKDIGNSDFCDSYTNGNGSFSQAMKEHIKACLNKPLSQELTISALNQNQTKQQNQGVIANNEFNR